MVRKLEDKWNEEMQRHDVATLEVATEKGAR